MTQAQPPDCPFPPSRRWAGIRWTGRFATYTDADTWYPSWSADGNLYAPFTDGSVEGVGVRSNGEPTATGHAVITGDDPQDLTVTPLGVHTRSSPRFQGNYPGGSLCYGGVWYYSTYYLNDWEPRPGVRIQYEMGPCAGFRWSTDHGRTWTDSPRDDLNPLFPERGRVAGGPPIKIGAPKVVDFGRDMEYSPDGRAYLVGHGATAPDGVSNWCAGDQIFLTRLEPSPSTINDPAAYEFFAGLDAADNPIWSANFGDIAPIVDWPGHAGIVTMTYHAPLRTFFMVVCVGPWHGGAGPYDTWLGASARPWGPWELVAYLPRFGTQAYFANIPSKFIGAAGTRAWLVWSANWSNRLSPAPEVHEDPPGSRYALCLREFDLVAAEPAR